MKQNIKEETSSTSTSKNFKGVKGKKSHRSKGKKGFENYRGEKPYLQGPNDIGWRTEDELMAKLVGNVPFGVPAGLPQEMYNDGAHVSAPVNFVQPGVMTILVRLMLGRANDYNSPINLAARKIYSFVRHANSGSKNYEATDLATYLGAVCQPLGLLGFLQRLYAVITKFSSTNRYTPKMLVESMGVSYDDIIKHQADLKYLIVWLGRSIGSLAFPDLPIFKASYEAFQFIYRDNDSPKEQYYMLSPRGWLYYDPTTYSTGGALTVIDPTGTGWNTVSVSLRMTFSDLAAATHAMMDVLLSDEDIGIISGDILKAYRDTGLFTPKAQLEDYEVIIKSEEMLQQIHNLSVVSDTRYNFEAYVQNPGSPNVGPFLEMKYNAGTTFNSASTTGITGTIIDAFSKEPDYKEVINCTVLQAYAKARQTTTANSSEVDPDSFVCDLFWPTNVYVSTYLYDGTMLFEEYGLYFERYNNLASISVGVSDLTNFDWHPMVVTKVNIIGTSPTVYRHGVLGDVQNIRVVPGELTTRIHENSILSLLGFQGHNFSSL